MKSLIHLLLNEKLIDEEKLQIARAKKSNSDKPLFDLFIELGFVSEKKLKALISREFYFDLFSVKKDKVDESCIKLIPYESAKKYECLPVSIDNEMLIVAMNNPLDFIALNDLKHITNLPIKPVLAEKSDIAECIEKYYRPNHNELNRLLTQMHSEATIEHMENNPEDQTTGTLNVNLSSEDESNIVRLANAILSESVKRRATDVHIEPQENYIDVRFRIDGVLQRIMQIPSSFRATLTSRIKILTNLNIAETRSPQDGRTRISVNERLIDIRISTVPTYFGEKIALRLLDKHEAKTELLKLGLQDNDVKVIREAISRPQGIILCTGPTGSGKTSTLYACLNHVRKKGDLNIITIEDPVEYLMEGLSQIQVNPAFGVTFAVGLKSILRQDPNVILVGEIRDKETAEIAFRSSLTGHLVLSTLHTNSAVNTVTRLLDIGLEPYLIASSLRLVIAQRLIKLSCQHCIEEYTPSPDAMEMCRRYLEKFNVKKFYRGAGCDNCNFTGYFGRTAICELLTVSDRIKYLISRKAPEDLILREAQKSGFKPLIEAGIEKAATGLTTIEEIIRVVDLSEEETFHDKEFTKEINKLLME